MQLQPPSKPVEKHAEKVTKWPAGRSPLCHWWGFKRDVFPSAESLKSLFDYFAKHLPLSRTTHHCIVFRRCKREPLKMQISASARMQSGKIPRWWLKLARGLLQQAREDEVGGCVSSLFLLCRQRCTCSTSSGCPLRSGTGWFVEGATACAHTANARFARPSSSIRKLSQLYLGRANNQNQKLRQLLACSMGVHDLYRLAVPENLPGFASKRDRKTQVKVLLRKLLACGENRLNCVRNVGGLVKVLPRLKCLQLKAGFGDFWNELRKVAKAVTKQTTPECSLAAVLAFRLKLPADSPWRFYLTSADASAETRVMRVWTAAMERDSESDAD
ncbi:hypothetical protein OS493_012344 [Desmophyllum pertusum]|uniref:Uncharacterized protein n=1 Tax=Desmophyllum pertusum TaxID=174260 RepID=A0A9W9ZQE9_9CNID|nr:hypothetical protein OS493_012344 [Desmophyllum pertusum]